MNSWNGIGRTTREVELRYSQSANPIAVARFTLAVNRTFKREGQPDADFINCICFGKRAEALSKYVAKGQQIGVTGRIQTGSYDKDDGTRVYTTDIVVDQWYFAENKKQGEQSNQGSDKADGFYPIAENIEDDDLPF